MAKQISELSGHIILYSKNWYRKTDNHTQDLKQFLSKWGLQDIQYIRDADIYDIVSEAFVESCDERNYLELLKRLFRNYLENPVSITMSDVIERMLGLMSILQIKNNKEILIVLPKPNYKYLPKPLSVKANKDKAVK